MNCLNGPRLIGNSRDVLHILWQIRQVAQSNTPVLIRGESGVGKRLVAEAIQFGSVRAKKPFVRVHCAALPNDAIESELYGKESEDSPALPGAFETTRGGTVLLDEVAALPLPTQAKLLHVLQEREFERFGSNTIIPMTARLLATTNRPLEQLIHDGQFHAGLFYQLSVFPIYVPPLRERRTDIPLLANSFIEKSNATFGKNVRSISAPALDILMNHSWPANVRELEDSIEHAVYVSSGGTIQTCDLPPTLYIGEQDAMPQPKSLKLMMGTVEKGFIVDALRTSHGNISAAARQLGMSGRMLSLRVQKYGIEAERFKRQHTA